MLFPHRSIHQQAMSVFVMAMGQKTQKSLYSEKEWRIVRRSFFIHALY
jgi:hypothetical protein